MASTSPSTHHFLTQVGSQFVSQFYTVLHSSPNYLYRFYTDESTVTHADGGSETEPPSSVTVATQRVCPFLITTFYIEDFEQSMFIDW